MQKAYSRIRWENYPSGATPLNEANLNKIDSALDEVDNRVITLDTTKAAKAEVSELFSGVAFNESTGVITFTRKNGSQIAIDTKLEKLAVNFAYDPVSERLIITLDDGTKQYADLSALITVYEFLDSDTIAFAIEGGRVKAIVKKGSIHGEHLQPDYLADITVQAGIASASAAAAKASETAAKDSRTAAKTSETNASNNAIKSQSYAVGGTNSRDGEDTDNSKHYSQQAQTFAGSASESASKANTKAGEASASAEDAASFATDANNSKTAAAQSASGAAGSAATAAQKAGEAAASAETATAKAGEAAASAETAKEEAKKAEAIANIGIATTEKAGIAKPDGHTILADENGTFKAVLAETASALHLPRRAVDYVMSYDINEVTCEEIPPGHPDNPMSAWCHIYTAQGPDVNYASQFAVGMTSRSFYIRNKQAGKWSGWLKLATANDITYSTWLPSKDYDLIANAGKGIQIYSVNPDRLPAQGAPEGLNQYATCVVFGGVNYKIILWIDVLGKISAWSTNQKKWVNVATSDDLNALKTSFQDGCSKIATAITDNGVATAENASPDVMAANIGKIRTPDHTGKPQHIDARRLYNSRFEVAVAKGYHGYNFAGGSYEYMTYAEVASTIGLTAEKLATGQTVIGITGTGTLYDKCFKYCGLNKASDFYFSKEVWCVKAGASITISWNYIVNNTGGAWYHSTEQDWNGGADPGCITYSYDNAAKTYTVTGVKEGISIIRLRSASNHYARCIIIVEKV